MIPNYALEPMKWIRNDINTKIKKINSAANWLFKSIFIICSVQDLLQICLTLIFFTYFLKIDIMKIVWPALKKQVE